jgi:hypothetical protein
MSGATERRQLLRIVAGRKADAVAIVFILDAWTFPLLDGDSKKQPLEI